MGMMKEYRSSARVDLTNNSCVTVESKQAETLRCSGYLNHTETLKELLYRWVHLISLSLLFVTALNNDSLL